MGTWHIPDVPPVVKPEPEEDLFGDMNLDEDSDAEKKENGGKSETPASGEDEPLPEPKP